MDHLSVDDPDHWVGRVVEDAFSDGVPVSSVAGLTEVIRDAPLEIPLIPDGEEGSQSQSQGTSTVSILTLRRRK